MPLDNPNKSPVVLLTDREILAKILAELRIQTIILADAHGGRDDITQLRTEILLQSSDL